MCGVTLGYMGVTKKEIMVISSSEKWEKKWSDLSVSSFVHGFRKSSNFKRNTLLPLTVISKDPGEASSNWKDCIYMERR